MSTDGNLPDLKFPQTGGQGNAIHLSANTLKQHGRNGEEPFQNQNQNHCRCEVWLFSALQIFSFF